MTRISRRSDWDDRSDRSDRSDRKLVIITPFIQGMWENGKRWWSRNRLRGVTKCKRGHLKSVSRREAWEVPLVKVSPLRNANLTSGRVVEEPALVTRRITNENALFSMRL